MRSIPGDAPELIKATQGTLQEQLEICQALPGTCPGNACDLPSGCQELLCSALLGNGCWQLLCWLDVIPS